jgi:hypothetical protein
MNILVFSSNLTNFFSSFHNNFLSSILLTGFSGVPKVGEEEKKLYRAEATIHD